MSKIPSVDTLIWRAIGEYEKILTFGQRSELAIKISKILKEGQQSTTDFDRLMTLESEVLRLNKALAVTADMLDNHNRRLMATSEKVEAIDEGLEDHENKFDKLDEKLWRIDDRISSLERRVF